MPEVKLSDLSDGLMYLTNDEVAVVQVAPLHVPEPQEKPQAAPVERVQSEPALLPVPRPHRLSDKSDRAISPLKHAASATIPPSRESFFGVKPKTRPSPTPGEHNRL